MLIALDDLHWADSSTLDLLEFLSRRGGVPRCLLVGAFRSEEKTEGLGRLCDRVPVLEVSRLGPAHVRAMVSDMLALEEPSDSLRSVSVSSLGGKSLLRGRVRPDRGCGRGHPARRRGAVVGGWGHRREARGPAAAPQRRRSGGPAIRRSGPEGAVSGRARLDAGARSGKLAVLESGAGLSADALDDAPGRAAAATDPATRRSGGGALPLTTRCERFSTLRSRPPAGAELHGRVARAISGGRRRERRPGPGRRALAVGGSSRAGPTALSGGGPARDEALRQSPVCRSAARVSRAG